MQQDGQRRRVRGQYDDFRCAAVERFRRCRHERKRRRTLEKTFASGWRRIRGMRRQGGKEFAPSLAPFRSWW